MKLATQKNHNKKVTETNSKEESKTEESQQESNETNSKEESTTEEQ